MVFVACNKEASVDWSTREDQEVQNETTYYYRIHPNNGEFDIIWSIEDNMPMDKLLTITYEGYVIEGFYLDSDFTIELSLDTLHQFKNLNKDVEIFIKWTQEECRHGKVIKDAGKDPTCTETGLTEGSHCATCNKIIVDQTIIPELGHDYDIANIEWTWTGYTSSVAKISCKRDGCTHYEEETASITNAITLIPTNIATGIRTYTAKITFKGVEYTNTKEETLAIDDGNHDIVHHDAKAPTCTDVGWEAYDTCSRCDYTTYVEKKATGHSFDVEWTNDETYHWHASTCGHDVVDGKAKHTYNNDSECTVCGYIDTKVHGTSIRSKSLEVNGTNLYAIVSNAIATFSFYGDIEVAKDEGAKYGVYSDIFCSIEKKSKVIELNEGNNICYILVENDDNIQLYTVTIRRRPKYTVSFSTLGSSVENQYIEEGSLATEPATSREGYDFVSWDYDFTQGITEDTIITASWEAIVYTITYNYNVADNSNSKVVENTNTTTYTIEEEVVFTAPSRKDYTFIGWDIDKIEVGSIGDKTIKATWKAIDYEILYDLNDSSSKSKAKNNANNPSSYTIEDTIILKEPSRDGYLFISWEKSITNESTKTITAKATWSIIDYTINYDPNGGTIIGEYPTTFNVEQLPITLNAASNKGYVFNGWETGDDTNKTIISSITVTGNLVLCAQWSYGTEGLEYTLIGDYYYVTGYPCLYQIQLL